MTSVVDLLIITGDSNVDFYNKPSSIKEDVRRISYSMYDYHSYLGMRTLGPYKAAWAARRHGYKVQVISKIQLIELNDLIEVSEKLMDQNTLLGLGTSLLTYPPESYSEEAFLEKLSNEGVLYKMLQVIKHFRQKYKTKVILGGAQAIAFSDVTKADYVIHGQAENELPKLLDQIKRHGIQKKPYDWNITSCDFKWHQQDFLVEREPIPLETARGCIFECKFCRFENIGKKKGTFERPLSSIREELVDNYNKYKTTHYWLMDDTFNDNNDRVNEFCEMVETLPFQIKFVGYLRIDLAHRYVETTRRLFKAGLVGCSIGIESFHPEAAAAVGKPFSAKHGKEFLDYFYHDICESNIVINTCHIVGLPGESKQHLHQTIDWYKRRPHIHVNWSALSLSDLKRLPPNQTLSNFDKNAGQYGYKFFDDKPRNFWVRGDTNSIEVRKFRTEIFNGMKSHNINAGEPWSALHYLSILNISPKQAREIGWFNLYQQKTNEIRQHNMKYFSLLKQSI